MHKPLLFKFLFCYYYLHLLQVPEACCILDPDQKRLNNLVPADSDCTKSPSTVNSNMNKVYKIYIFLLQYS